MNTVDDRPRSGHPREPKNNAAVEAIAQIIRRNSLCKQKIMAQEMKIPPRTMSRIMNKKIQKTLALVLIKEVPARG